MSATPERRLKNWLLAYNDYTDGTESPPLYHLWVGLGVLSGAAQRKIYLEKDFYQVHSNLYLVLCSPRGRSRKSTALRIGKNILKAIGEYGAEVHFSTQASSVAALVSQLSKISNKEHQSLTASISELGSLLGTKGSTEMTDFLTDIFDCNPDWDKQTIGRGMEKIEKPWLNLMAGVTPQWLGENLSKTAVEGGFVGRAIFIYEDTRRRVARPRMTAVQRQIQKDLVYDLAIIAGLKGTFDYSTEGGEYFDFWYEQVQDSEANTDDTRLGGYYERKALYVEKVAMLLSLSESNKLIIEKRHVQAALQMLKEIEPGMYRAFSAVGKNIYSADHERIKQQILKAGDKGVPYKKLLSSNIHAVDKDQIDKIIYTLIEEGLVDSIKSGEIRTFYDKRFVQTIRVQTSTAQAQAGD